jgi:hypothetical protein
MQPVRQRTQAAMLSVALALGAVLPGAGAAVAQEPDQEREGTAAPEPTPPDSTADPDFDPGGDTGLQFNVDLRGGGGGDDDSGDGAPVDAEPTTDPDALAVPLDDSTAVAPDDADPQTAPADTSVPPAPAPAPPVAVPTPVPPPTATIPEAEDQQAAGERSDSRARRSAERKRKRERARQRAAAVRVTLPAAVVVQPAPVVATTTAQAPVEPASPAADESGPPPELGKDTHAVRRGESLWTIASDLLGDGATASEIAAESNRIYSLNRDRIGDDPNMLIAGTVLRLR